MEQHSCERGNPVKLTELMCFQANMVKWVQKAACVHSYLDSLNWFILASGFSMKDVVV